MEYHSIRMRLDPHIYDMWYLCMLIHLLRLATRPEGQIPLTLKVQQRRHPLGVGDHWRDAVFLNVHVHKDLQLTRSSHQRSSAAVSRRCSKSAYRVYKYPKPWKQISIWFLLWNCEFNINGMRLLRNIWKMRGLNWLTRSTLPFMHKWDPIVY